MDCVADWQTVVQSTALCDTIIAPSQLLFSLKTTIVVFFFLLLNMVSSASPKLASLHASLSLGGNGIDVVIGALMLCALVASKTTARYAVVPEQGHKNIHIFASIHIRL